MQLALMVELTMFLGTLGMMSAFASDLIARWYCPPLLIASDPIRRGRRDSGYRA